MSEMDNGKDREHAFDWQLATEIGQNKDVIEKILHDSKVGQCGGKCKGFKEDDLKDLCPACLRVLEEESDEIFSVSPMIRLLGDAMNGRE